jgi:hypothetical protein
VLIWTIVRPAEKSRSPSEVPIRHLQCAHRTRHSFQRNEIRHIEMAGRDPQLWLILGDGVNQAADLASGATSIPSWNLTPWMTFGNWF